MKSPRQFVYKKPRLETRVKGSPKKTDKLEKDRDMCSELSPIRSHELERDNYSFSATSSARSDELERGRDILSAPSSNRLDGLERDSNSVSAKRNDELDRERDIFSARFSTNTEEAKGVSDLCGYEVTSEVAVIKSIDCNPEDWVFQKREKAKVIDFECSA